MSTIKVQVTTIANVRPHPNADSLDLATVGGWQMCVKKGVYRDGDPVVYFEQGTVLPRLVADNLGVTKYLSEKTDIRGERVLVVHRIRFVWQSCRAGHNRSVIAFNLDYGRLEK